MREPVDDLEPRATTLGIELVSLPHEAALDELATAAMLLTAPGLTTALECFQLGRPTPPRSYSQWCTLKALRTRGLAPHALHWEDLSEEYRLGERLPEAERGPARYEPRSTSSPGSSRARDALSQCLSDLLDVDAGLLADQQSEFFHALGANGARVIAAQLVADFGG